MITITACPLCGSDKLEPFYSGTDAYYSGKPVQCSACTQCSLLFLDPQLTPEEYTAWYASVFQDKRRNITSVAQAVLGICEGNKYQKKLREMQFFKDYVGPDSTCLEIGGGWGTLARALSDTYGCAVDVIEPSVLASQVAREHFGLTVYTGSFEDFAQHEAGSKQYDMIYAYHVFEHIADPNRFLELVKTLLKPGGALLLALPDTSRPEVASERLFHIEHCFYYTPRTIGMMLRKHGFETVRTVRGKRDMKVLCRPGRMGSVVSFSNTHERKQVRRAIGRHDLFTAVLRWAKKIVFMPLSAAQADRVNRLISWVLHY